MKAAFFDKLVERLDRLDPQSLQTQFLRLAQERGLLETVFQSIQEGILVIDGHGRLTYANGAAERLVGFSADSARGRPVSRFLRDVDWHRLLQLDESEWSRLISHEIEVTYPEHRFLNFYAVPMVLEGGGEAGALVILRDVTNEREREASVLESERLNALKLLAAGVAHEIGNPLNALHIHLQLLGREIRKLPDEFRGGLEELANVAGNEVSRLDMIITQFLRAIRPTKPKLAPQRIESILEETLLLMKEEIQNRKIDVEIDCRMPIPRIPVDRDQIKQLLFNVIKNAFQAMPDGGSLRIALSIEDQFLAMAFRDTGKGIRPEDFAQIFEPYHTTKTDGSGLGLMIVQRIIQEHGGRLEVASKPEEGTCFTVFLPLAERRVRLLKASKEGERPGIVTRKAEENE